MSGGLLPHSENTMSDITVTCTACGGDGIRSTVDGEGLPIEENPCSHCSGTGKTITSSLDDTKLDAIDTKLDALDTKLDIPAGATKGDLLKAMEGHVIAQGQLIGKYKRQ